ncbi:hypothetical protein [Haloplanus pelagicus]|uniref:hypothetical protein n=1 Tax=Haloplanus pelagicus TaxID=2949995 RepID=UPI00203D4D2E|nr:hypothetical protein [Haloplanus sp. HW8-1]
MARITTLLEASLKLVFAVGIRAALVVSGLFFFYVVIGISAILLGWPALSYPIFSLKADPFFVTGGAVVGLFIVQSSGSFVLYHMLVGIEDDKSQLATLFGFISLGFGGALLRVTLPPAIQFFLAAM